MDNGERAAKSALNAVSGMVTKSADESKKTREQIVGTPAQALKGEGIKAGREAVKKKMAKKAVDAQEKAEEAADKAVTGA